MNRKTFQILACLARLEAMLLQPSAGFLQAQFPARLPLVGVKVRLKGKLVPCVFLWTFTLPTPTATQSELQLAWHAFIKNRQRDLPDFKGVRRFEESKRHRWHVHAITLRRVDVGIVRKYSTAAGFGRINVKPVPVEKASYLGKYLTKSGGSFGARMLACVGFRGCPDSDINLRDDWCDFVFAATPQLKPTGQRYFPWHDRESAAFEAWARSINSGRSLPYKMTKLESKWLPTLAKLAETGETLLLGEWRGCKVTGRFFDDDKNPDVQVFKVAVNHSFERADGRQILLVEYLPDGTKVEDVKISMQAGDKCIACLSPSGRTVAGMSKSVVYRFEVLSKLLP